MSNSKYGYEKNIIDAGVNMAGYVSFLLYVGTIRQLFAIFHYNILLAFLCFVFVFLDA